MTLSRPDKIRHINWPDMSGRTRLNLNLYRYFYNFLQGGRWRHEITALGYSFWSFRQIGRFTGFSQYGIKYYKSKRNGGKLFKFSALDSDLEYFFEPHQTFWQKADSKLPLGLTNNSDIPMRMTVFNLRDLCNNCEIINLKWINYANVSIFNT